MQLADSADEARFRAQAREWLRAVVPTTGPAPADRHAWAERRRYDTGWQARLHEAGYAGINWPAEHGGRGATPGEHLIFLEESVRAGAPDVGVNFVGLLHAGPTLILEGRDDQRAEHLPAILRGEATWCQGFSEPDAGSDLASLRTRAVRDGDDYVVTGQKVWTSYATVADYCELLVRTDPDAPKHRGITWVIMPMDSPGIEVRPLRTIEGSDEFAELFLDEVRIPVANRVGEENDGWRVTQTTFSFERGTAFVSEMLQSMELVADLADLARRLPRRGGLAWDDAGLRRELGLVAAELDGLWALTKRNVTRAGRGMVPMAGASSFKLAYTGVRQHLGDLAMRILGRSGLSLDDLPGAEGGRHVHGELHSLAIGIAAGTSQIQRNILAEKVLGLPANRWCADMDFDLDADQLALQEATRKFCADRYPMAIVRAHGDGFDRGRWRDLAALGVFSGLEPVDAVVVFEELGRGLVPGPLVATALAGDLIDGVVDGDCVVTLTERSAEPVLVDHGEDADIVLVLDDAGIDRVDAPALAGRPVTNPLDPTTPLTLVESLPAGERIAGPEVSAAWRRRGSLLTAALLVGIAGATTDLRRDLRQGPPPVRPAHRVVPGGQAPAGRHVRPRRGGPRRAVRRRRRCGRRAGGGRCPGPRRPGRARQRQVGHPGPRWRRIHVGGRPAPVPQAGPPARHPVRVGGRGGRGRRRPARSRHEVAHPRRDLVV